MHELSIVLEIVKNVENIARRNGVSKIDTLVLQIGELSSTIPRYVEACYPMAVEGSLLADTKLEIEVMPGNAFCRGCGDVFNLRENDGICPGCGEEDFDVISGREFFIKEILTCEEDQPSEESVVTGSPD
ncbi:MAG: hydrogenase maturation nickel metallochaperone HypA [Spirochaetales bacterium]|nr:hydrogenase maturation nickel metallochaperone HypA [Spirochaetales bacterium]